MRSIITSPLFLRKLRKILKNNRKLEESYIHVLTNLQKDIFQKDLRTHKLHGMLENIYAASVTYRYRLLFYYDDEYIYLLNIGSHDEVY